ncbi:MAG: phospho-sugar mutase [Thermotogota bacterium]
MEDIKKRAYETKAIWKEKADENLKNELLKIEDQENEIIDRFYKNLEFGTGGMRGKIGVGSNRMNIHTVARATQGLANYLKMKKDFPSVVIAYDNRHKSKEFSKIASEVLAANNINVYLFNELTATPILSYAVRKLECDGGIVITASHNPSEYNGYKVYTSDGTQAVPKYAKEIIEEINVLDFFADVKRVDFDHAVETDKIEILSENIFSDYMDEIEGYIRSLDPIFDANVKTVFTPLHGTGLKPVQEILNRLDVENYIVKEQAIADGDFPTVESPNPEEKSAFKMAIELAKKKNADIVMATDPDSDRIGVFEKNGNDYSTFNGNEMGVMLSHFIITKMKEHASLPKNAVILKTVVSTDMIKEIAKDYGVKVVETLTGFKFIGEKIEEYESTGENKFIFGFEESYGYLANTHARDKDAVIASALIVTLASELKAQGKNLREYMEELNEKYGYYKEKLFSFKFEGYSGSQKIINIINTMRKEPPINISGHALKETVDYNKGINNLPKSNVIELRYGDIKLIARPSGTEPKIKFYVLVRGRNEEEALKYIDDAENSVSELINKQ